MQRDPFLIRVYEPSEIRVAHVRSEETSEHAAKNEVDLALDGPEEMEVDKMESSVAGPENEPIPSHVSRGSDGHFHVKFTPRQPGPHLVDVRYEGYSVDGAPFTVNVLGKGKPVVNLHRDQNFNTTSEADITVKLPPGYTAGQLTASVIDPSNESLRTVVVQGEANLFHVRFVPIRGGPHTVNLKYGGVPLENSPFIVDVEDTDEADGNNKCVASGGGLTEGENPLRFLTATTFCCFGSDSQLSLNISVPEIYLIERLIRRFSVNCQTLSRRGAEVHI